MSPEAEQFERAVGPEESGRLRERLDSLVRRLRDGSLLIRKRRSSWIAVPVESGFHLTASDASHLADSIARAPHSDIPVYGLTLEPLEGVAPVARVPADTEGLIDFGGRMAHFNVALMPGDSSWVVALTTDDYFLVLGPKSFVARAVGVSVEEAYRRFEEFAGDSESLRAVFDAAEGRYPIVKTGRWVIVPGHALRSLGQPDLIRMEELALRA